METYTDESGYPGCRRPDGVLDMGDSAAILGNLWFFDKALDIYLNFDKETGTPLRHPDHTKWWGKPDRFSRDQLVAVLCGLIARLNSPSRLMLPWLEATITADTLKKQHAKRGYLLAWNTRRNGSIEAATKSADITGPEVWALWLRLSMSRLGQRSWKERAKRGLGLAILHILDLELFLSAVHWRFFRGDRVTRNHMLNSLCAYRYSPTLVSALVYHLNDWDDLISRWAAHCEAVGEYPTAHLFKEHLS